MSAAELAGLDATAQAALVRRGEASPAELVEAAIERIEELDARLNAVIHRFYQEGRQAACTELPDGIFKGVPFLLKDLLASFAGQPLHMGTRTLKELDFRAPVDTYLAQRFRAAGLVTLGKTNTPEFGILPTTEPVAYGATLNPWDVARSSGGSSGGAAAAVASGMVPLAHANDAGGSIRVPASACGLVGLKPTRQRTSLGPLIGDVASGLAVEFALTRSVRDAAALLDAVQGPAPGDPYVAPPSARPYVDEIEAEPPRLRVGLVVGAFEPQVRVHPSCVAAARDAATLLEELGHEVTELDPATLGIHDLFEPFLVRWTAGQAMRLAQLSFLIGRVLTHEDVEPLTWALAEEGKRYSASDYLHAVARHQALCRNVAGWYDNGLDLVLTPTMTEPPPLLGSFDDSADPLGPMQRARAIGNFTGLFNVTGEPAISLPLHWDENGLPIGVQLAAPFGREDLLIRVSAQLERARPWRERIPPVFASREGIASV